MLLKLVSVLTGAAVLGTAVALPQETLIRLGSLLPFEMIIGPRIDTVSVYRTAPLEQRRVARAISATGVITPVALILVSSQVSGQVKDVLADFNSQVSRGDLIATIDPVTFQIEVEKAEAEVGIGLANLAKAELGLRDAESKLDRKLTLYSHGTVPLSQREEAEAARDLAQAQVMEASSMLAKWNAVLSQARSELDRTHIVSPVDGTVIQRNVEAGQIVAASLQAPTLFTIARDLREMQVNTFVSEGEIGKVRIGQKVEFTVDSYPERSFKGQVIQIRKQPQTSQNVVTYTVVASAPNPELLLLPGMTATASIVVEEVSSTLSAPITALRFRLAGEPRGGASRVYVVKDGQPVAVAVVTGISDEAFWQIEAPELKAGDNVIVGLAAGSNQAKSTSRGEGRLIGGF